MSTLTTIPEWMEASPVCTYGLVAWDDEDGQKQSADLTIGEYDSLKRHLAKLRGLIPDAKTAAQSEDAAVQSETEDAESPEEKQPQSAALRLAVSTLDGCVSHIERQRDYLLEVHEKHPFVLTELLTDGVILDQILSDWDNGAGNDRFPADSGLQAACRLNLDY